MLMPALLLLAALLQLPLQPSSASPTPWFDDRVWAAQSPLAAGQLIQETKTFVQVSSLAISNCSLLIWNFAQCFTCSPCLLDFSEWTEFTGGIATSLHLSYDPADPAPRRQYRHSVHERPSLSRQQSFAASRVLGQRGSGPAWNRCVNPATYVHT